MARHQWQWHHRKISEKVAAWQAKKILRNGVSADMLSAYQHQAA